MIAVLGKGRQKNTLRVWRIYDTTSERNTKVEFDLPLDTYHTVLQFCTEYLAVSMQNDIFIFNVMAKCKVQSIKMTGMF